MQIFSSVISILLLPSVFSQEEKLKYFTKSPDFRKVVNCRAFVDKTLLIKEILQGSKIKLITAPRGFGKTTNMNMLRNFLSPPVNRTNNSSISLLKGKLRLFRKLDIYKKEREFFDENLCNYPVVYLEFEFDNNVKNDKMALQVIRYKIHVAYVAHYYLTKSEKLTRGERKACKAWCHEVRYERLRRARVLRGLKVLTKLLHKHFGKKVIVLFDAYDGLFNTNFFNKTPNNVHYIYTFVIEILRSVTRRSDFVDRVVVAGEINIAMWKLDKQQMYEFLESHPLTGFFGFQKSEVDDLFKKLYVEKKIAAEAREWYEGYNSKNGMVLFNPYSILNFLEFRKVKSYLKMNVDVETLRKTLVHNLIEENVINMLRGDCVHIDFELKNITFKHLAALSDLIINKMANNYNYTIRSNQNKINLYFKILLQRGYFSFGKNNSCIKIPNQEIKKNITHELSRFYFRKYKLDVKSVKKCVKFFKNIFPFEQKNSTFLDELNIFHKEFQQILIKLSTKKGKYVSNKLDLENIMFVVSNWVTNFDCNNGFYNQYTDNNGQSRTVRLDLFMYEGPYAIIMEFKHHGNEEPDSKEVLQIILDGKYDVVFGRTPHKIEHYLLIGLSANNKANVSISCLLDTKNIAQVVTVPDTSPSLTY